MDKTKKVSLSFIFAVICIFLIIIGTKATISKKYNSEDVSTKLLSSEEITLVPGENYTIIFSSDANQTDAQIAIELRSSLDKSGQRVDIKSDAQQKETAYEILIGDTDRALSAELKEACQARVINNSLVWGFAYKDGKFAYAASSDEAFNRGKSEVIERFVTEDNHFVVASELWLFVSLSRADYEAELKAEQDRLEAEEAAARLERIENLKNEISAFVASDFSTRVTLDYTVMPKSTWGSPALYPNEGEHPRLNVTDYMLDDIKEYLKTDEGKMLYAKLLKLANNKFDGVLDAAKNHTSGRVGFHNVNEEGLAIIEARAFLYLLTGDEEWGYKAILAMKNFFKTSDIRWIYSDQCREFGRIILCGAEVYDWCYDLLTEDDKNQFIIAITDICSGTAEGTSYEGLCKSGDAYMEVGYPPSKQSSVAGHGSEAQILRDYLAVAIAIFDENPSWYEYVGARVYNDYVKTRNYYYQSGTYQQGIYYAAFRHNADLWSAWLLLCATGESPYVEEMKDVVTSFYALEAPDGTFLGTGDGARYSVIRKDMPKDALLAGALFGNTNLRSSVLDYWDNFSSNVGDTLEISYVNIIYLSSAYYNKTGTTEGTPLHENEAPITYNSYPVGQMITRSEWNNENAPMVFMKIGERHTANHEHGDAGSFQIFYKGLYSGESGVYDSYASVHWRYYHQATVAHNSLLVFNPDEAEYQLNGSSVEASTNLAKVFYTGSQRSIGETASLNSWLYSSEYDTGKVTGAEYAFKADGSSDYAYLAGDITDAYTQEQASYVGRRMFTLYTDSEDYPMYFIVYDAINAASESFVKKFLLHTSTEPVIDEENKTVTLTDNDGRLVLHSLLGGDKFEAVGGEGKNYLINGIQCAVSSTGNDKRWGRVEISNTGSELGEFLSLMYVTDATNDEKLEHTLIDTELLTGVQINDQIIVFSKNTEPNADELVFNTEGIGLNRYFVTGLCPGTWHIEVDGVKVAQRVASSESGLISFYAPAGEVHVKPGKDIAPPNGGRIVYNTFGGIVPDDAPLTYEVGVPVTLPTSGIVRDNDEFMAWYTSPTFEEETKITEVVATEKGKFNVYAKYRPVPVNEDYEDKNFRLFEKSIKIDEVSYTGKTKIGATFETVTNEATNNTYLRILRGSNDPQMDAAQDVVEYIGDFTSVTYQIDLALDGNAAPLTSNFRIRERTGAQIISLFTISADGMVNLGGTDAVMKLACTFQKVIITVDFAKSTLTAYNLFGEVLATKSFAVPEETESGATTTLEWMKSLQYTFNWYMGGGKPEDALLVDNIKIYCGEYEPIKLAEDEGRIIYNAGDGEISGDAPIIFKKGEALTLPIPSIKDGTFKGWYTTETFDEGTEISVIDKNDTETVTVWAKYSYTIFKSDFTDSEVNVDSSANQSSDGMSFQFKNKTGATAVALKDESGNTYIKIETPVGSAPQISENTDVTLAEMAAKGQGKITVTVDIAALTEGKFGVTTFRLRSTYTNKGVKNTVPLFTTTKDGKVLLGGDTDKVITTVGTSLTQIAITIDVNAASITAYAPDGTVIATKTGLTAPSVSGLSTFPEWIENCGQIFNWDIGSGSSFIFDNIHFYTGEYLIPKSSL